jgi:hypothetical protein
MMSSVASKKRGEAPSRRRLSWDGRLWDTHGLEYHQVEEELTREMVITLVTDKAVVMAISRGSGSLMWPAEADRQQVWREDIEPNFHDQPGWKPPRSAPGQLPFHAELWVAGARRLLLLTDRD